jgi:hypothetical protein
MVERGPITDYSSLSKRAARRMIQRAFVLAGRNRIARQHIRESRHTTLWVLEDWGLEWTLALDRGRLEFERRASKHPDATFTWTTAAEFFRQVETGSLEPTTTAGAGPPVPRRTLEPVFHAFGAALRAVLQNPVDGNGDPLV